MATSNPSERKLKHGFSFLIKSRGMFDISDVLFVGNDWSISQLKVVLLGGRNSGKSCVGNLILGKEEFVTKERTSCSRRLGVVAGRWITVVDTPGWWCDFSAGDTSQLVKREIVSSVSLCPPGPHVFLIVVKASSAFSERRCRAVEEHVDLLGDGVWGHCLVVFTCADRFLHKGAEECVERGGAALRRLTEKCGRRSHSIVLNDPTEGAALLLRIQELMSENGNRAFEMEESIWRAAAEEKRAVEERAHLRLIGMKRHRALQRGGFNAAIELKQTIYEDIRKVQQVSSGSSHQSLLKLSHPQSVSEPVFPSQFGLSH